MARGGSAREGGRPARGQVTTDAVRDAVQGLLGEVGYRALTIEGVAARAGVAKTTIYRRWASKAEMVFDLMLHSPAQTQLPDMGDRGSLAGDLEALSARMVALVAGPVGGRIFPGLICDLASDPQLMQRFGATVVADGRDQIAQLLARSVRRGELADAGAAADLQAVLIGAAIMFPLLQGLDEAALSAKITELARAVVRPPGDPVVSGPGRSAPRRRRAGPGAASPGGSSRTDG